MRRGLSLAGLVVAACVLAGVMVATGCAGSQPKTAWTFEVSPEATVAAEPPPAPGCFTTVETIDGGRGGPLQYPPRGRLDGPRYVEDPPPQDGRHYFYLRWPLSASPVSSPFGSRRDPIDDNVRFHHGIDLSGRYGEVVEAAARGVVATAGWNAAHGRMVIVVHRDGFRTTYSHLSQILVEPGMHVSTGQAIGQVGNSGRSTGPHLHFEVTRYGAYLDPLDVLGTYYPLD